MMLNKKTSKKLIINFFLLSAFIFLAAGVAFYFSKNISRIRKDIETSKLASQRLQQRETINAALRKDMEKIDPELEEKIKSSLPRIDNILPFVETIENLSKKYGFDQNIRFGNPVIISSSDKLVLYSIDYSLNLINGNNETFNKWLGDMEALSYFNTINNFNLNSSGDWKRDSAISINGKLYVQGQN